METTFKNCICLYNENLYVTSAKKWSFKQSITKKEAVESHTMKYF